MNEDRKKQIAVFRFGVIHEFVGGAVLDYGEQERLLGEKCARGGYRGRSSDLRIL